MIDVRRSAFSFFAILAFALVFGIGAAAFSSSASGRGEGSGLHLTGGPAAAAPVDFVWPAAPAAGSTVHTV